MCRGTFVVATTVGVVEALKDQGYCKMNSTMMKLVAQHAKNHIGSVTEAKKLASPSPSPSTSSSFYFFITIIFAKAALSGFQPIE